MAVLFVLAAAGAAYWFMGRPAEAPVERAGGHHEDASRTRPFPIQAAVARRGDIDVVLNGLGTVTAYNTATVTARVDGLLEKIYFHDGQIVKKGDVLALIDPRPYQAALDQAVGQLARDAAQLDIAKVDFSRYKGLLAKQSIAEQQVADQKALVYQDEGLVKNDQALVDTARLNLQFTRITAPIPGRLGIRQMDEGNMVHAATTAALVVITQMQPIYVIFPIPAASLPAVLARLHAGDELVVDAYDQDNKVKLASGKLLTVDNQMDVTTGTVKFKAEFPNADGMLFPNQFVNARLRVEVRRDAVLIPSAAVMRGASQGMFVYVVKPDKTVGIRPVTVGAALDNTVAIEKGLEAGDEVVIDGADKLREGSPVEVVRPEDKTGKGEGGERALAHQKAGGPKGAPPDAAKLQAPELHGAAASGIRAPQ